MNAVRALGAGAVALGLSAAVAGEPHGFAKPSVDIDRLAATVASGRDHVGALQLAEWIRDRKPGLRVIDVRDPADFAAVSIPTAENIPIRRIASAAFAPGETVVLYSEQGAHAAQAWVFLKAMGVADVLFVAGGLADWRDEVMQPVLRADASPQEAAAFRRASALSLYFGGEPRVGGVARTANPGGPAPTPSADLARLRRRGC